jgi:hypothetical protein
VAAVPARAAARDLFTLIGYGDRAFETALWNLDAREQTWGTRAAWTSVELDAVAVADVLLPEIEQIPDDYDEIVNQEWLDGIFADYNPRAETGRCDIGETRIIDMRGTFTESGREHVIRYWVRRADDGRMETLNLIFPAGAADRLEEYAARFVPDAPSCNPETDVPRIALVAGDEPVLPLLERGSSLFPGDTWRASANDTTVGAISFWISDRLSAVTAIETIVLDGTGEEDIDGYLTPDYFNLMMSNYQPWERRGECRRDGLRLYEFTGTSLGRAFVGRLWVETLDDRTIRTTHMLFPVVDTETYDAYSRRLYPVLDRCGFRN